MKINDTQASGPDPSLDPSDDVDSSRDDDQQDDEPSPFSRVLAKKQEAHQEVANPKGGKRGDSDLDATKMSVVSTPSVFGQVSQAQQVESKRMVEVPPQLQQLIREISVAAGKDQVQIELNSNVLKGLHIRIEKQNGAVAIEFQSTSPEVAKLLSSNVDALSQGLADRGVSVADIRITEPRESASVPAYKNRSSASEHRGQGGRQGGKR